MSAGISLFLFAIGAILAFAVNYQAQGVDIAAIGWILMGVGVFGILMYLMFLASFAPFYRGDRTTTAVEPPHTHLP
ncbi:MAG TPA: DUF6458 family protein [Tepidiformaceae bacterium]|nr:DUF6458 family protein [Tepidiformaceae bacterium]